MTQHSYSPDTPAAPAGRPLNGLGGRLVSGLQRRVWAVSLAVVVVALILTPFAAHRTSAEEPNFDPDGEIYEVMDLVDDRFTNSDIVAVQFVVEARDGNALTRAVLLEWLENTHVLLETEGATTHLAAGRVAGVTDLVDGIWSIAQAVDDQLPTGLAGATEDEVALAVSSVLARGDAQRTLAQSTSADGDTWRAPAFMATLLVDNGSFPDDVADRLESGDSAAYLGVDAQEWVRDVQEILQGDESTYRALGAGFDGGLAFMEQLSSAAPFILGAIVLIVLLVGTLLRSYWAAGIVTVSLACTLLVYGGALDLLGFDGGMLLGFIVPIAGIAFGVDFFIHAVVRSRVPTAAGGSGADAPASGLVAVAPALIVALASSVVAFMANTVSGVEAIVQFGIGAAVLLTLSLGVLGFLAPAALARIEQVLEASPRRSAARRVGWFVGLVALAVVGGVVVTMALVAPFVGAVGTVLVAGLLVALPYRRARRRRGSVVAAGAHNRPSGGRSALLGRLVAGAARARAIVLPVVIGLAIVGLVGFTRVESDFALSDFYSADSEFIEGIELLDDHFGTTTGAGEALLYVEGDLGDPNVLRTIDRIPAMIAEAEDQGAVDFLGRDLEGEPIVAPNLVSVVRAATGSDASSEAVMATTGVEVTDGDGDGLPDSAAQVRAIVDVATVDGVIGDDGRLLYTPESVWTAVAVDGERLATTVTIGVNSLTDDRIVDPARAALEDVADQVAAMHPDSLDRVAASGATIVQRDSLNSFTSAMRIALPVAFVACVLLVGLVLRSLRDAVVAVGPSLLVVVWIYGLMHLVGLSVNVVTATIAAIAVGVGLDYSTHFTMRYREELRVAPTPVEAVRRAGTDTGGPLAISALSSIVGFGVMALAPMPIFATFGLLTAAMVLLSLVVSLFVLPSLLLVTSAGRPRTGPSAATRTEAAPADDLPPLELSIPKETVDA